MVQIVPTDPSGTEIAAVLDNGLVRQVGWPGPPGYVLWHIDVNGEHPVENVVSAVCSQQNRCIFNVSE